MNELQITIAITHLYSYNVMLHQMALKAVTNVCGGNVILVAMQPQVIVYQPSLYEHTKALCENRGRSLMKLTL
jgi:hypothetical protein